MGTDVPSMILQNISGHPPVLYIVFWIGFRKKAIQYCLLMVIMRPSHFGMRRKWKAYVQMSVYAI